MTSANIIGWFFSIVFAVIGILNVLLVHPVPGIFYLLFATAYLPQTATYLKNRFGFSVPLLIKIIIGIIILWGTLAVSDLAEILGL